MSELPNDIYTEPEDVDVDTLANLGPLTGLAGVWEGRVAWTSIRTGGPANGRLFSSTSTCSRSTRRQMARSCCTDCATTRTSSSRMKIETYHDQVGYWLWEPATEALIHTLTIPRGQAALATGKAARDRHEFRGSRPARLDGERHLLGMLSRAGLHDD
jgi:hypothetical protein